ncbi:hypothetical protein DDZ13_07935 [Coraliomargarita sinensis]|uniref:Uncharacterized protein n=1 Tax=Coraliomargarita sinensis TaxID=2174842 RepID=A0A317ZKV7_9BACT|nr:hypothetical protein [Coraliomargarita sinensis]PXA04449.1 hypothetical protein DDZ13_07935 [Coraliomargarita sinensis]
MNKDQIRQFLKVATGAEPPQDGLSIRKALAGLDAIAKEEALPRDLAHYLSRRSYMKALEWLENPDMPHEA